MRFFLRDRQNFKNCSKFVLMETCGVFFSLFISQRSLDVEGLITLYCFNVAAEMLIIHWTMFRALE